jgi:hypothetical protein
MVEANAHLDMQTRQNKQGSTLLQTADDCREPLRKRIIVLVPRGEVIRNFVYTGALDEVARDAWLALFTVATNVELDESLRARYKNIYPLHEINERWPVRFQREIIDISHNRWVWSKAAQERSRLRDAEAISFPQKSKRAAKKLISYPFANRTGLSLLGGVERTSSRWLKNATDYEKLFKNLSPTLVFNGSHIHSRNATQAVQAAQWLGIPTATFVFSWDNLTSQGRIMLPYNYFLVWNESMKRQLLEMYEWIKPENVFVTGTPQFDFHFRPEFYLSREAYCEQIGADPNRPIVFYATGMPNHMPGETEIVENIADMLMAYDPEVRPQLLVRVYPKDRSGRFEQLKNCRKDILFPAVAWEEAWLTPKFEDSYALVNALRHCSIGINVASTVSLELCMFDKPVINVGYNPKSLKNSILSYADYYEFDHYKPVVDSDAIQVARSEVEMSRLIKEHLANPASRKIERRKLINQIFGSTLDGNSSKRVAEILLRLAGNRN